MENLRSLSKNGLICKVELICPNLSWWLLGPIHYRSKLETWRCWWQPCFLLWVALNPLFSAPLWFLFLTSFCTVVSMVLALISKKNKKLAHCSIQSSIHTKIQASLWVFLTVLHFYRHMFLLTCGMPLWYWAEKQGYVGKVQSKQILCLSSFFLFYGNS